VDSARIADLLSPFLTSPCHSEERSDEESAVPSLGTVQLHQISTYLDLLLRWNVRINLTAVRGPEHIVTRHFGESLFAARCLFPDTGAPSAATSAQYPPDVQRDHPPGAPSLSRSLRQGGVVPPAASGSQPRLIDVGSGAGFPGLPTKIWDPSIRLTLIESNHKKATFLREVARSLTLTDVNVFAGRAEEYLAASATARPTLPNFASPEPGAPKAGSANPQLPEPPLSELDLPSTFSHPRADIVTLRAVERFATILPTAATLVRPAGRLCLLIGHDQIPIAASILPSVKWQSPMAIPLSESRVCLIASKLIDEPK
jgi:16S rRNA (guanine527-N7)-methyltransferase